MTNKNKKIVTNYFIGISSSVSLSLFLLSGILAFELGQNNPNNAVLASDFGSPVGTKEIVEGVNYFFRIGFLSSILVSMIFVGITIFFLVNYQKLVKKDNGI